MQRKQIIQYLRSFVLIPAIATSISGGTITNSIALAPVSQIQQNIETLDPAALKKTAQEQQAKKIEAYFLDRGMPLAPKAMKMVLEADKNGLDWTVIAAIAVRESTGGKFACKNPKAPNNAFGYGSCKFGFKSTDEAIEKVARTISGNSPATAHHYQGDLREVLEVYNGRAVASYADDVMSIMDKMKNYEV